MSTNIERAAEVIYSFRAEIGQQETSECAQALAAEGLLVTDEPCETCMHSSIKGKILALVRQPPAYVACPACEGTGRRSTMTDEQARLIRLGEAVETMKRNHQPTPRAQGWNSCLDAIYAKAERNER